MPFWSRRKKEGAPAEARMLQLEAELQALRLTLEEREAELRRLRAQWEQERARSTAQVEAQVQAQMAALMEAAAPPVAQVLLQGSLIEAGQEVRARDVWLVVQRLVRVLEAHGLEVSTPIGTEVAFDPDRHQPLSGSCPAGTRARVRLPGLSYRGRLIHKAGVVQE